MTVFKKAIPRRMFLRGAGAAVALPLLDSMVPAFAGPLDSASKSPVRLGFVYVPNGIFMDKWSPAAEGAAFQFTPILESLAPFRDRLLVLSGLSHLEARAAEGEAGGDHARASSTFLTGVHPKKTEGAEMQLGISVDQVASKELGKYTQLGSLEVALDSTEVIGTCEAGYSCAYSNTLCWRSANTPIPMENHPRAVFEHLFGDSRSSDPKERLSRIRKERSILDFVSDDVNRLLRGVGPGDSTKLTEYLDAIRDTERRIQVAEAQSSQELPVLQRPVSIPATFKEHAELMFDLQVIALQCDLTRVVTFMMGHEQTNRAYSEIGIPDSHHPVTHHGGNAEKIEKVIKINTFHIQNFAYFLEKLRSTRDGDGNLLDHSMIVYGSGLSDGNMHRHDDLPILLAGGGSGQIKGGRHIHYPKDTPMPNLYLSLLDKVGVPMDSLGTSTGKLGNLSFV